MSDLTGLLPGQALANIAQRGQDRLTKAQAEVKEKLGKESLTKGREGGLGGLKLTTFGKDLAKSAYDRFGTYISQTGKKAVRNVVNQAKNALKPDEPIQMGEIGEVAEIDIDQAATDATATASTAAGASAESTASTALYDGLGRVNAAAYTGSTADDEAIDGVLQSRFAALPAEAQAATRTALQAPELQLSAVRNAGAVGSEERVAAQTARQVGRSKAIEAAEDDVEADKAAVEGEDYAPPRPTYGPKPAASEEAESGEAEEGAAVEQAEGAPELPAVDYTAGTGTSEGAVANLAAEGEVGGVAEASTTAEIGLTETVGGILDDTGILAPLGLIAGAIGVGLAARKRKPPTLNNIRPVTAGGYSYQVGL